jgi:hypothetical protein
MTFSWQAIMIKALVRPFALFAQEPIIQLLGAYMAYLYGILYRAWSDGARSAAYPNQSQYF